MRGKDEDKKNFLLLLKELKEEFNSNGFLLSICGAAIKETIDRGYDVPEIMNYVDWVNLVTYDYYTSFDNMTGPNSPLFGKLYDSWETFHKNVNYTIHYWLQKGAHREKLLMGLAAYGQGFNLKDPTIHGFDAPIFSKGTEGPLMDAPRAFGFNEICKKIKFETWTVIEDPYTMTAYMYKGHQWISFDNLNGISYKAVYSRYLQLAGVVVWSIDVDDFEGECNDLKNPFTLLQRVNSVFDLIDTKLPINIVDPKTSESRINSTTTSTNPLPTKQPLDNHITKSSTTTSQTSISSTISTLTSTPSTTTSTNT
ncbi:chitinase-3-like protein 1, partial [Dinothrombium tinctorium]